MLVYTLLICFAVVQSGKTALQYECEPGWTMFQDHCYFINNGGSFTWSRAKSYCTKLGADLLSVSTAEEQKFINDYAVTKVPNGRLWIGLNDLNAESTFEWSDGTALGFTQWEPDQPNDSGDCVILRIFGNDWNDIPCGTLLGAYCKKEATKKSTSVYYKCEHGWTGFQDHCYFINNDELFTWLSAKRHCSHLNAHLLSVSTAEEEKFINEFAGEVNPNGRLWIGLNDLKVEGNFEWSDGTALGYTKWEPNQPNDSGNCGILRISDNNWNDIPCGTLLGAYCKKKANPRTLI